MHNPGEKQQEPSEEDQRGLREDDTNYQVHDTEVPKDYKEPDAGQAQDGERAYGHEFIE